jgi:trans-2,3-dihydro-3-hydroxyanthranilate isomerase
MHAIAREFNLPETAFVMRPSDPANHVRLRIFTVAEELPFAGHPTIGAAVFLSYFGTPLLPRKLRIEEIAGVIHCDVSGASADAGWAEISIPRLPQKISKAASVDKIADALGIEPQAIGFSSLQPECWSAGIPFTFVPLGQRQSLARCQVNLGCWDAAFSHAGSKGAFVFCPLGEQRFASRMFAPRLGIPEDPATGSAVAAFAGMLADAGLPAGPQEFVVEQGVEMGRPSEIGLSIVSHQGHFRKVFVSGHAILVSQGSINT